MLLKRQPSFPTAVAHICQSRACSVSYPPLNCIFIICLLITVIRSMKCLVITSSYSVIWKSVFSILSSMLCMASADTDRSASRACSVFICSLIFSISSDSLLNSLSYLVYLLIVHLNLGVILQQQLIPTIPQLMKITEIRKILCHIRLIPEISIHQPLYMGFLTHA